METTTILRYFHELGRSSPLRRILNRASELLVRDERAVAPASGQMGHWKELSWEHGSRAPAGSRAQSSALSQSDLFGWLVPDRPVAPAAPPVRPVATSFERSRAARLAKPVPAHAVRKLRVATGEVSYAKRRHELNREEVARLLEVNAGVSGVRVPSAVELPRFRFSARVDLWKGRPVGTPFVMGN